MDTIEHCIDMLRIGGYTIKDDVFKALIKEKARIQILLDSRFNK